MYKYQHDFEYDCSLLLSGIRKHSLDKPFDKNTGIDPDKKKGSKRSRRRAGFEIREKEEKEKLEKLAMSEGKGDELAEEKK
jgi:hypothetical protein